MLQIVPVDSFRRTLQFLELPHRIHATPASRWVAPLKLQERAFMGSLRGPKRGFWMVLHEERPVARLGACVQEHEGEKRIHFGFFECMEGYSEAVPMLFERAGRLAPGLEMHGPYCFEMEDPYIGVLVDGFEHAPTFLMSYNPPFYGEYLEAAGLQGVMDLNSYLYTPETVDLERMATRAARAARKGISIRSMNRWRPGREMRNCADIANRAWAGNWGYQELKEEQVQSLTLFCAGFFDSQSTLFARHEDRDVGFIWVLQNFNEFFREARGRITPKLVWQLLFRRRSIRTFRGYGLGVLPEFQHIPVSAALVHEIMKQGQSRDWKELDLGWVLASNTRMNAMARALGGKLHKVHRLYKREPA